MAFDNGGRPSNGRGLYHIRVECALYKVSDISNLLCLFLKDFYEDFSDTSPLLLWVNHPAKGRKELLGGINTKHIQTHLTPKKLTSGLELPLPQQSVIYEY